MAEELTLELDPAVLLLLWLEQTRACFIVLSRLWPRVSIASFFGSALFRIPLPGFSVCEFRVL